MERTRDFTRVSLLIQAESFSTWHILLRYHVFLSQKKNLFCRICSLMSFSAYAKQGPSPRQPGKDVRFLSPAALSPEVSQTDRSARGPGAAPREALLAGSALSDASAKSEASRSPASARTLCLPGAAGGPGGGSLRAGAGCANPGFSPVASTGLSVGASLFSPSVWQHTHRTHIQIRQTLESNTGLLFSDNS